VALGPIPSLIFKAGTVGHRRRRNCRRRKKRAGSSVPVEPDPVEASRKLLFWNAQGLLTELLDLGTLVAHLGVSVVTCVETFVKGSQRMRCGKLEWLKAQDSVDHPVSGRPCRGMGAFVDMDKFPGAHVSWCGKYSFCLWLPAGRGCRPVSLYTSHIPGPTEPTRRAEAWEELWPQVRSRGSSAKVLCGDFNSRMAMNGDSEVKKCARCWTFVRRRDWSWSMAWMCVPVCSPAARACGGRECGVLTALRWTTSV